MPSGSLVITLSTVQSDSVRDVSTHSNTSYHFLQATTQDPLYNITQSDIVNPFSGSCSDEATVT